MNSRLGANNGASEQDLEIQVIAKALQDSDFKQELMANPKTAIAKEFGAELPADIQIRVVEESQKVIYIVLPYLVRDKSKQTGTSH